MISHLRRISHCTAHCGCNRTHGVVPPPPLRSSPVFSSPLFSTYQQLSIPAGSPAPGSTLYSHKIIRSLPGYSAHLHWEVSWFGKLDSRPFSASYSPHDPGKENRMQAWEALCSGKTLPVSLPNLHNVFLACTRKLCVREQDPSKILNHSVP